jgi:hypothetical protein
MDRVSERLSRLIVCPRGDSSGHPESCCNSGSVESSGKVGYFPRCCPPGFRNTDPHLSALIFPELC